MTKQRKKIEDDIQKLMDAEYFSKQIDRLNSALNDSFGNPSDPRRSPKK